MFHNMWEKRALRYFVYGTSTVLLSEIIFKGYRWLRDLLASGKQSEDDVAPPKEFTFVIWTNEIIEMCCQSHFNVDVAEEKENNANDHFSVGVAEEKENNANDSRARVEILGNTTIKICPYPYCTTNNSGRILALINNTKYCIDLAMYTFSSFEMRCAILRAHERGVSVRIMSDKEMMYCYGSQLTNLAGQGIPIQFPGRPSLMHHKFCVLDGPLRAKMCVMRRKVASKRSADDSKREDKTSYDENCVVGVVMTGSLNWTMQGLCTNYENMMVTSNKSVVKAYETEFQRIWEACA